ncbi:hypothetical protein KSP39_PZI019404 [Platanthera zijinensis]|uniref:Uncharacterized protein n=1 Tax=Platanthera zijinensis TaxID=2320716 RepID=A0AAP0B254_9ASPA
MANPWGKPGAWALDAERAEAEEREGAKVAASAAFSRGATVLSGKLDESFPTLNASVTKPKNKKAVTLSISELHTGTYVGPGGARREPAFETKGLTTDEKLRLPTGPRERTAEELEQSRGFRSYGSGFGGGGGGAAPPRRRSEFSMDDEPRRGGPSDLDLPSRADESDNWGTAKKFSPAMESGRQERYGSLGSGGSSKADEVDNWSFGKKSSGPPPSRNSGFGSGFRDSSVPGADSDRWVRGGGGGSSLSSNGERGRPKLVLDPPKRESGSQPETAPTRASPFGAARPREEVLAEKGMDWRKMETEIDVKKTGRPSSSHSSRPSSAQSSRPGSPISQISGEGGVPKPRPKVNPSGTQSPVKFSWRRREWIGGRLTRSSRIIAGLIGLWQMKKK